ncbi:hypothetical protein DL93DRAFT_2159702 [Clavulina sp. PMI_390]|nr:hypothetical protein DL93DRAFT_2159702 [Clavulina sp. PMI_390]
MAPSAFDLTPAQEHELRLTLGPMQIGNFLNAILFGIVCIQVSQYFSNFRDPLWIRSLVILAFIIDVAQTALMMYMTWEYSVTHFADFTFLGTSMWALSSIPFFSVPVSWIVQGFYAWRIWVITKVPWWSIIVVIFAIIQGAFGIYAGIGSFLANSTADNVRLQHIAIVWFVFAILCDVSIMAIMIWSLSQSKTGFKDTDNLITKINRSILETGAATSVTVLVDCLFLFLIPGTDMHLVPVMAVGKVYSNSFLYLLNSRGTYRKVSSARMGTSDFARSLERGKSNATSGNTSERPSARAVGNGRGLNGLRFAPNEDALSTPVKSASYETHTTHTNNSQAGMYVGVTRETYVMSDLAQQANGEDDREYTPGSDDSKAHPFVLAARGPSSDRHDDNKTHYV